MAERSIFTYAFAVDLICPLLAIVTLVFTDSTEKIRKEHVWLSILPTFLYGIVYLYKVVYIGAENGGWHDFYGFNINGLRYVSLVVMLLATGLLAKPHQPHYANGKPEPH